MARARRSLEDLEREGEAVNCTDMLELAYGRAVIGCDREEDHPGLHYDNEDRVYWLEGAPKLEEIEW